MIVFLLIVIIVILLWQNGALDGLVELFLYLIEKIWLVFKALLWLFLLFGWVISPILATGETGGWGELQIGFGIFFPLWLGATYIFGSEGVREVMKGIAKGLIQKTDDGVMKLINWLTGKKR